MQEKLKQLFKGSIGIIGDIGLDKYSEGEVDRISPEAPVPVVKISSEFYRLGLASNVAHNLKSLEINPILVGSIGSDSHGEIFKSVLKEKGIDPKSLVHIKKSTIVKARITTKMQQICRVDYEDDSFEDSNIIFDAITKNMQDVKGVIISDYAKGLLTNDLTKKIIQYFNQLKVLVAIDPNTRLDPLSYSFATILKPNLKEAKIMAKVLNIEYANFLELANKLREKLSIKYVVITLGDQGMVLSNELESKLIPTRKTEVYDVSGAGDTVISLIVVAMLSNFNIQEAIKLSNIGAGIVVGKRGTATVTLAELMEYFKDGTL